MASLRTDPIFYEGIAKFFKFFNTINTSNNNKLLVGKFNYKQREAKITNNSKKLLIDDTADAQDSVAVEAEQFVSIQVLKTENRGRLSTSSS